MSNEAKALVESILRKANISFEVSGGAQIKRGDWDCFQWSAVFRKGRETFSFDYYTGLGHQTKPKLSYMASRPIKPHAADILSSLLLDAGALDQSFDDWCSDFGGDTDSIKAFNTYQLCCEIGKKMRTLFTREQREALQTALQDY